MTCSVHRRAPGRATTPVSTPGCCPGLSRTAGQEGAVRNCRGCERAKCWARLGLPSAEPEHDDVPALDRVERLPGASHWVHHDEAARVNELLTGFFAPALSGGK